MKVDLIPTSTILPAGNTSGTAPAAPSTELRGKFEGLLNELHSRDILGTRQHQELTVMQEKLSSATQLSPRELLFYQMRVGEFGLRVEMISKMSESAITTVKKLQQTQG